MMKKTDLKYIVPNGISFLSLTSGVGAILTASQEYLLLAGLLIITSYGLDMFDGFSARKLSAQSEFGLNLDSLTDMVSLGVAPSFLVFQHLRILGANLFWVVPVVSLVVLAGAFRLARFNTLPPKTTSNMDSVGLTISQSGATMVMAVLADKFQPSGFLPLLAYIPLLVILGLFMVSRIPFPPSQWFFKEHKQGWLLLGSLLLLLFVLPLFSVWFIVYMVYLLIATSRALFFKLKS
jgi:CDP-diacylglycerol--serine O-phosphatidyltransferase